MLCYIPPSLFFPPRIFSPKVSLSPLSPFLPTLALGFWACPSHLLTTNEVFGHLRLGPQRPLKLTLWEKLASFHPGLPGVADWAGAFEGGAEPTQE